MTKAAFFWKIKFITKRQCCDHTCDKSQIDKITTFGKWFNQKVQANNISWHFHIFPQKHWILKLWKIQKLLSQKTSANELVHAKNLQWACFSVWVDVTIVCCLICSFTKVWKVMQVVKLKAVLPQNQRQWHKKFATFWALTGKSWDHCICTFAQLLWNHMGQSGHSKTTRHWWCDQDVVQQTAQSGWNARVGMSWVVVHCFVVLAPPATSAKQQCGQS